MKTSSERLLHWTPRVLGILFAAFISIFALDVFGGGYTFWETVAALGMHLVPTALILGVVAIGWRWEWLGGLLFIALGTLYLWIASGQHWSAYLLISGPLFLVGILFLVGWWYRARHRPASP